MQFLVSVAFSMELYFLAAPFDIYFKSLPFASFVCIPTIYFLLKIICFISFTDAEIDKNDDTLKYSALDPLLNAARVGDEKVQNFLNFQKNLEKTLQKFIL